MARPRGRCKRITRSIRWWPGTYVAQRRFETCTVDLGGERRFPCLGVYTIDWEYVAGAYARLSATPLIDARGSTRRCWRRDAAMTPAEREACFAAWAPDDSLWSAVGESPWRFFTPWNDGYEQALAVEPVVRRPTAATSDSNIVVIVDLPGAEAVHMGVAMARHSLRPVRASTEPRGPACRDRRASSSPIAADGGARTSKVPPGSRRAPGFLLTRDETSRRNRRRPAAYDDRWVAPPQDFPSGALLASRGVRLRPSSGAAAPLDRPDLAHVLRRWQDHGIRTRVIDVAAHGRDGAIRTCRSRRSSRSCVTRPSALRPAPEQRRRIWFDLPTSVNVLRFDPRYMLFIAVLLVGDVFHPLDDFAVDHLAIAMCVIAVVGDAPCQCRSPARTTRCHRRGLLDRSTVALDASRTGRDD